MRVGLSFSRCIKDIVDGVVDINDVLVIISRTDTNPTIDEQWKGIWKGYTMGGWTHAEWEGYENQEDEFRKVATALYLTGKLHQPRQFGGQNPMRRDEIWLETVLPSEELENNPAAKAAWDKFQTIAGLANVNLDKKYQ